VATFVITACSRGRRPTYRRFGLQSSGLFHLGSFPVRCLACVMPHDVTLYGAIKGAACPNLFHHQFCKISHSHTPTKIYIRRHFMSFLRKWIPIRNVLDIYIVSICGWMDLIIDSVTGGGDAFTKKTCNKIVPALYTSRILFFLG